MCKYSYKTSDPVEKFQVSRAGIHRGGYGIIRVAKIIIAKQSPRLALKTIAGSLAEWSIAPVLKTGNLKGFQGSNP
jgi:hypothetical protein